MLVILHISAVLHNFPDLWPSVSWHVPCNLSRVHNSCVCGPLLHNTRFPSLSLTVCMFSFLRLSCTHLLYEFPSGNLVDGSPLVAHFDGLFYLQTLISWDSPMRLQQPPGVARVITKQRHMEKDRNSRRHHRKLRRDDILNHLWHLGYFAYFNCFTSFFEFEPVCELACSMQAILCSHFVSVLSCTVISQHPVPCFNVPHSTFSPLASVSR